MLSEKFSAIAAKLCQVSKQTDNYIVYTIYTIIFPHLLQIALIFMTLVFIIPSCDHPWWSNKHKVCEGHGKRCVRELTGTTFGWKVVVAVVEHVYIKDGFLGCSKTVIILIKQSDSNKLLLYNSRLILQLQSWTFTRCYHFFVAITR